MSASTRKVRGLTPGEGDAIGGQSRMLPPASLPQRTDTICKNLWCIRHLEIWHRSKRKRPQCSTKRAWTGDLQPNQCVKRLQNIDPSSQPAPRKSWLILSSKPVSELLQEKESHHLSGQTEAPHDYDSGNDTSSPPSSKTGVSRASVTEIKRNHCQRLATDRDNASDSGNSVTSYASLCKPYREESLSATLFSGNSKRDQITLGCRVEVVRSPKTSSCPQRQSGASRRRLKNRTSSSSRSRSRSSGSSRYSGRYSRSPTLSSCSSYSRSPSYTADLRRRGSVASLSSRGSYRYSVDRLRDRKRTPSSRESDAKHEHKVSGKRRRRKSYSPMKKRRRDSPSHLEARRITSARKRPIPYFRPSPSSSSRSTSVSSWSSLFTRSRSRSPIYSVSRSRSRSRSHSYSSYRSYSRSSSWNSIFGTRSRSRSAGSLHKRHKTRH